MTETALLKRTLLALGRISAARLWRNNTGQAWMGHAVRVARAGLIDVRPGDVVIRQARPVQFGLPGSGDIHGLRTITIRPEHVGMKIGQYVSVETKTAKGRQSEQQVKFGRMVTARGGLYIVARDADEAAETVRRGTE